MSLVNKPGSLRRTETEAEFEIDPEFDIDPELESGIDNNDPFRLGWRYITQVLPDGETHTLTVPLTPHDLLFPQENDQAVQLEPHVEDCLYLYAALKFHLAGVPGVKVLADHRVWFDVPDLKPLGPDVVVFFDYFDTGHTGTFEVAQFGARPILVVEIASADTRKNDYRIKKEFYHQAGAAYYLIIDARIRAGQRKAAWLVAFRHTPDGYEPIPADDQGRIWVEPLNVGFQIVDLQVRCIQAETGRTIDSYLDQAFGRIAAEERALAESVARRAAEAESRAAEERALAESVARRTAEAESRAAEERALAAEERALVETAARLSLEAQMAALQVELRRLRGEDQEPRETSS